MTLARNHTLNYVRHKKVDSNKVVDNENDVEKTAIQPAHEKSLMLEDLKTSRRSRLYDCNISLRLQYEF